MLAGGVLGVFDFELFSVVHVTGRVLGEFGVFLTVVEHAVVGSFYLVI
jgi:hypothetical protein